MSRPETSGPRGQSCGTGTRYQTISLGAVDDRRFDNRAFELDSYYIRVSGLIVPRFRQRA